MESSRATIGRNEGSNGQRNINTIIGFCMWTSFGLVAILLSRLDSIDAVLDARHDIALVVGYMWFVLMIVTFTVGIRFIRNRERFHKAEVVFWPSRCRHCAEALFGPQYARSSTGNTLMADDGENSNPDSDDFELNLISTSSIANVHENLRSRRNPHTDENISETLPDFGNRNSAICSSTRYSHGIHFNSSQLNLKRHAINRAVLNVFMVFCFICCVGILDEAAYSIACYAQEEISVGNLVGDLIADLIYFVLVLVIVLTCHCYFDAKFVRTFQNLLMVSLMTALSIWITMNRFTEHFSGLIDEANEFTPYCFPNTTTTNTLYQIDKIIIPFYVETSVISVGLATQLWKSFVPKPLSMQEQNSPPFLRAIEGKGVPDLLNRWISKISRGCRRNHASRRNGSTDNRLLPHREHNWEIFKFVKVSWKLSLLLNAILFAVSMFLMFGSDELDAPNHDIYLRWCVEIAAYLAFSFLCFRLSCTMRKTSYHSDVLEFYPKGNEIVLFITSGGTFFLHFLRIITAVILLCKHGDLDKNEIDLCVIGIINSLVTMTTVWQMTYFLLSMPMKSVTNRPEVKWLLVCLINIIVLCGTGWFVMILDQMLTLPPIEILYFGPRYGHVLGSILVPFLSFYKIHAAMTAYESYKETIQVLSWRPERTQCYGTLYETY